MYGKILEIKSSGEERNFSTGSKRDCSGGKGRMDLLPSISVIAVLECSCKTEETNSLCSSSHFLMEAYKNMFIVKNYFENNNNCQNVSEEIMTLIAQSARACCIATGIIEAKEGDSDGNKPLINNIDSYLAFGLKQVSLQYEQGAIKYGENNWRKGQPISVLMDSGLRHISKAISGIVDEPHGRASAWNLLGMYWTILNRPEMCRRFQEGLE